jgi:hypothetical protein
MRWCRPLLASGSCEHENGSGLVVRLATLLYTTGLSAVPVMLLARVFPFYPTKG